MTGALYRVSHWCSRHGWLVVGLWLLAIVVTNGLNRGIPGVANPTFVLPGANSYQAQTLLNEAFPSTAVQASPIVINNADVDFSSGAGAATVKAVIAAVTADPAVTTVGGFSNRLIVAPGSMRPGVVYTAEVEGMDLLMKIKSVV